MLAEGPTPDVAARRAVAEIRELQRIVRTEDRPVAGRYFDRVAGDADTWETIEVGLRGRWARYAGSWVEEFDDPMTLHPAGDELESVDIPVLLTYGERSSSLFRAVGERMAERFRNALVSPVASAGHLPALTNPGTFVGLVSTFLLDRNVPPS
jgi:pimeloyl-ACP methyl ester carboxylesterase